MEPAPPAAPSLPRRRAGWFALAGWIVLFVAVAAVLRESSLMAIPDAAAQARARVAGIVAQGGLLLALLCHVAAIVFNVREARARGRRPVMAWVYGVLLLLLLAAIGYTLFDEWDYYGPLLTE